MSLVVRATQAVDCAMMAAPLRLTSLVSAWRPARDLVRAKTGCAPALYRLASGRAKLVAPGLLSSLGRPSGKAGTREAQAPNLRRACRPSASPPRHARAKMPALGVIGIPIIALGMAGARARATWVTLRRPSRREMQDIRTALPTRAKSSC